jgi:hypothetical protein
MHDPLNSIPSGMGNAAPYGKADPTSAQANALSTAPMGGTNSGADGTGYKPETGGADMYQPYVPAAGRADRLGANIYTKGPQMNSLGGGVI